MTLSTETLRIPTYADVQAAAQRIAGHAHRTPVLTSATANSRANASLFFKAENLQRAGAFKFRGAFNAIASLAPDTRQKGVIAYSSGNHAQAVAYAARLHDIPSVIVMPSDAPKIKVTATRGYGAQIVFYDRYTEDRQAVSDRLIAETGGVLIPPYDHPDVIAGQGTAALELFEEVGELDVLVVPVGGGGLLAGCALAAHALSTGCKVFGVEPEAGNDGQQSLRKGSVVHIPVPKSIADGALSTHIGYHNFPILQQRVEDIVSVTDDQLVQAMRLFAERMKIIVEPTGCLAAAAVFEKIIPCEGKRVGIVLSGGNVDMNTFGSLLASD